MADLLPEAEMAALRSIVALAQDKSATNRRVIFENISDLFLSSEGRLTDRERALMGDILAKLVREMEMRLRQDLAARLARIDSVPHELVVMLANDEIEVARPVLMQSKVLREPDLIEIVKHRSQEHLLAVALRAPLSSEVADAIVDHGDEKVIEQLLKNSDASLSRRALEYLVAESQQVDKFQQPLLARADLPTELAHRMFWWVSAALRRVILDKFTIDVDMLDDSIDEVTRAAIGDTTGMSIEHQATRLAEGLADSRGLDDRFLVQALRGGKITAFIAGLGFLCRIEPRVARRAVFDAGGESLGIACRAIGIDRSNFATIFLLSRQGGQPTPPTALRDALRFYDGLTPARAAAVIRYWRADREYLEAIAAMDQPAVVGSMT
jgi:uncharacterized protein (DUF2336 family)